MRTRRDRRHWNREILVAAWLGAIATCGRTMAAGEAIQWDFDSPRDVAGHVHIEPMRLSGGQVAGQVTWDPYVSLRLPPEGIDARQLTWLTVRLYSSAPADVLDVYYQSPDGRWCLGGKLPIAQGWATYRLDLSRNSWRETRTGDDSRQWGGPSKRVASLRIDPGNQAGRWVAIDYVRLHAEPAVEEGVTIEPRGRGRIAEMKVPSTIEAGSVLEVKVSCEVEAPTQLAAATAFVRLRSGQTILRMAEQPFPRGSTTVAVQVRLPTSAYWNPGMLTVEAGCYEVDLSDGPRTAEVRLINPRAGTARPPRCALRQLGGDPAIFVDGQPLAGFMFLTAGGLHTQYHREAAQAGVHVYSDWFGASTVSDLGHVAPDEYDYGEFDRYFAAILDIDPQAYFLPHVGLTGPAWWQAAHPGEMCQYEDGTRGPTSFASEVWRRDIGEDLRRLIAYLRAAPYADRILGYIFFNGYTAEWQMWGTWQTSRDDYSPPAMRAYRGFLAQRYSDDSALQSAWGDPHVTLAAAAMPDWPKRRPAGTRVLRDPRTERQAMDFYEFINQMDAEALLYMARVTREATRGESLVGTYYAYLTAHGINQQDSGHLAARRVFDSPDIDFLMSPPNYWYRKPGETSTFMSATDSLRYRGKLWLDESDHRTHLSDPGSGYGRASTLDETRGVFWREFAEVLTKRAAVSWFDMGGGWFSDPQILADMGQAAAIMQDSLARRRPFTPEVAVLVDPDSFFWMRPTMANSALDLHQVVTMPQSGAPWDYLLLSDIENSQLPDYKLYVFLNAFCVQPARREAIQARLKKNHATGLFVYAPGYFDGRSQSLDNMQALTGIHIACDDTEYQPQIQLEAGDPLAAGLDVGQPIGTSLTISPQFFADDSQARIAGRLIGSDRPGLVVKSANGWTSIYSSAMQLTPALMRNIARSAGVHIWLDSDDALYTDGQHVGVHAATAGTKSLRLPGPYRVFNARSGQAVTTGGLTVAIPLQQAETALLRLEKP